MLKFYDLGLMVDWEGAVNVMVHDLYYDHSE